MLIEDLENYSSSYHNWVMHDNDTLESDFEEYKIKEESKWKTRAERKGFRFPLFRTFSEYKDAIENAEVIRLSDSIWGKIGNLSSNDTIEDIETMVSDYHMPRDVGRIVDGIRNNDPIPYPVILKGTNGYFIMSGNTRSNVAKVMGNTPKALLVDVSENNSKD